MYIDTYRSIYISCISIQLSGYTAIYPSINLSNYAYTYLSFFIYLDLCGPTYLHTHIPILRSHTYIYLYVYLLTSSSIVIYDYLPSVPRYQHIDLYIIDLYVI